MIDILKSLGLGGHERLNPEAARIIPLRAHEVVNTSFDALRNAVYLENPLVVLEEDGFRERAGAAVTNQVVDVEVQPETATASEQPSAAPSPAQVVEAAGNVISMAAYKTEREQNDAEQHLAEARANTEAAYEEPAA